MARSMYQNTIAAADATGTLKALAGIQIFVYTQGTQTTVPIYQSRTGAPQKTNPIVTDATGLVEFFADVGEYDVRTKDTNVSPRIADRTVQWHSVSGADGGTPGAKIAPDAGLSLGTLGADVNRQIAQIGQVIDWWRPDDTFPVPSGWEICDGRSILAGSHDFGGGSITLPDLRNTFILGADATKINGAVSTNGDTAAGAPGIRGVGGSNAVRNLAHTHVVDAHSHTVNAHSHTVNAHDHSFMNPIAVNSGSLLVVHPGDAQMDYAGSHVELMDTGGTVGARNVGVSGGIAMERYAIWTNQSTPGTSTSSPGTSNTSPGTDSQLSTTNDMRPRHVGLLKIMKVRRS
jgi:hypothetical protein